jgi:hemerythrin
MHIVSWSDEMLLGVPAMDDAHKAMVAELGRLATATDTEFPTGFFALIEELKRDFREEEDLMRQINFPNPQDHHDEHARVLNSLLHVAPLVTLGDIAAGREVILQLPQWFLSHLSTLDLMLAIALDMASRSKRPPPPVFLRTERARLLNECVD